MRRYDDLKQPLIDEKELLEFIKFYRPNRSKIMKDLYENSKPFYIPVSLTLQRFKRMGLINYDREAKIWKSILPKKIKS